MIHVIDNVYLSDLKDAKNLDLIRENNIQVVCRLSEDNNASIYDDSIEFYNFVLEDNLLYTKEIMEYAKQIYSIIVSNKQNVLVHCNEGKSRSVACVIYYICLRHRYEYDYAYAMLKSIKKDIRITQAFVAELRNLFCTHAQLMTKHINMQDLLKKLEHDNNEDNDEYEEKYG